MKKDYKILKRKILSGYLIVLVVIGCMIIVLFCEQQRVREIERESVAFWNLRQKIELAHCYVMELATQGESVISWENVDYESYRNCRLRIDSLLVVLRDYCINFVQPGQLDTLRSLFLDKEAHLLGIKNAFEMQKEADSLLANRLPFITGQTTHPKKMTVKKKGIAGWFGKKESTQVITPPQQLYKLSDQLIEMQQERTRKLEIYADSLAQKNKELNNRLMKLIGRLDKQTEAAFQYRGQRIIEVQKESFQLLSGVITIAVILLLISFIVVLQDIRRRKYTTELYQKMLEMRKNIILTLSHDIRGPLNTIAGSAELAIETREKKKRNAHLSNIRILCKHILHLLNNLLDVYRLNEAKETKNEVTFHLFDLLERIATNFSQPINDKGLLFVYEFKRTDVTVLGDTDRIEQIINNLLTNAIKFTDTGTIYFIASYENELLAFEIKDTGIGMSKEQLGKIFTPFERGATAHHVEGFGLGLPITKGLVKLLGGNMSVRSQAGQGSVFSVTLPLVITTQVAEEDVSFSNTPLQLPAHVIVIDDDPMQLEIVKEMLERNGISCCACTTVQDVVREMRKVNFDLLLTDIQMAGTNGFDLLKLLRCSNIGNSRTIPVIAMTARGDRDKESFVEAGFITCIYKPFSMNELLVSLSSIHPVGEQETITADFSVLTTEVRDKQRILEMFILESQNNIGELEEALKTGNQDKMQETVHRMFPAWELLEVVAPLGAFRNILKTEKEKEVIQEQASRIINYAKQLIKEAQNEIERVKYEQENTDSGR